MGAPGQELQKIGKFGISRQLEGGETNKNILDVVPESSANRVGTLSGIAHLHKCSKLSALRGDFRSFNSLLLENVPSGTSQLQLSILHS